MTTKLDRAQRALDNERRHKAAVADSYGGRIVVRQMWNAPYINDRKYWIIWHYGEIVNAAWTGEEALQAVREMAK